MDIVTVDYNNPQHAGDLLNLLNIYARGSVGGSTALSQYVEDNLVEALSKVEGAFSLICYVDGQAAGLTNCFTGFSTFKCKPIVNIHDLAVHPDFRRQGIGLKLLAAVESKARALDCCKITLEVLDGNIIAKNLYLKFGFNGYELDPEHGHALFWEKAL